MDDCPAFGHVFRYLPETLDRGSAFYPCAQSGFSLWRLRYTQIILPLQSHDRLSSGGLGCSARLNGLFIGADTYDWFRASDS
jgi:hypothetical protein